MNQIQDKKREIENLPKYNPKYHNIYSILREIFRHVKVSGDFYDVKSAYKIIENDISQSLDQNNKEWEEKIKGLKNKQVYIKDIGNMVFVDSIDNLLKEKK